MAPNTNDGMSLLYTSFYLDEGKILLFGSLSIIIQSAYNNGTSLYGVFVERFGSYLLSKQNHPLKTNWSITYIRSPGFAPFAMGSRVTISSCKLQIYEIRGSCFYVGPLCQALFLCIMYDGLLDSPFCNRLA